MQTDDKQSDAPKIHRGADRSSPYPVSRLAPSFDLIDLATEIDQADKMVGSRLGGQLQVIAEQVRSLQAQARRILEAALRVFSREGYRRAFHGFDPERIARFTEADQLFFDQIRASAERNENIAEAARAAGAPDDYVRALMERPCQ